MRRERRCEHVGSDVEYEIGPNFSSRLPVLQQSPAFYIGIALRHSETITPGYVEVLGTRHRPPRKITA